jgi:hypothetical protein
VGCSSCPTFPVASFGRGYFTAWPHGECPMGSKSKIAWRTAARMAALAEEADNDEEREYYTRLRDAWITLANRCEFMPI